MTAKRFCHFNRATGTGRTMRLLCLLCLCFAVFGMAACGDRTHRPDLSRVVEAQHQQGMVNLATLGITFDQAFIFAPYSTRDSVNQSLGFEWDGYESTKIGHRDGLALVVLVRHGQVVGWFEHPRNQGDLIRFSSPHGYRPHQTRFRTR
jgi:hypothetical protein